jgi:hypothetical protein
LICAVIARGGRAPLALAVATIVLGLLLAIPAMMKAQINSKLVRSGDTPVDAGCPTRVLSGLVSVRISVVERRRRYDWRQTETSLKRELMARQIIAVVVGYVAMFVLISVAFTAEYMLLGARHAFKPGSFEASNEWIGIGLGLNLVISIAGGFICAAIR